MEFDPVEQTLRWWLVDRTGASVAAELVYSSDNDAEFRHFVSLKGPDVRDKVLVARLLRTGRGLALRPLALIHADSRRFSVVNLGLDAARQEKLPWVLRPWKTATDPPEEGSPAPKAPGIEGELEGLLGDVLERGTEHVTAAQRASLTALVSELADRGLQPLSVQLGRVLAHQDVDASQALMLRYLLDVYKQVSP
jgi:hypothetical protein